MDGLSTYTPLREARVVGVTSAGAPIVALPEDADGRPASVAWMPVEPRWDRCDGLRVAVAHCDDSLLIVALLDEPPAAALAPKRQDKSPLRLENDKEIVLECGKARIALRADGRIEILGGYVLSRSKGVQKIQGGSVQIN